MHQSYTHSGYTCQAEYGIVVTIMTDTQVRALIRAKVRELGSQMALARLAKVSPQYLTDVLKGRRTAGAKLLKAIGYELVREYRAIA